ncbi:MAG: AAA family ATPase [Candidatus Poribacteria bacterium]|nr:AAA family ATPase [Candidatus Poribacteria bacterium]
MVKITKIEIKNFKAFYGMYQIDLHKAGKNLLIYGENGSGKTSLYKALELFLDSSENDTLDFKDHQNLFNADNGYIKLHLRTNPTSNEYVYEWSDDVKETVDSPIITASKSKGFLDYKALLHTHYLNYENDTVNVFDLLIENLLANLINDRTGQSISEDWHNISEHIPLVPTHDIETFEAQIDTFNVELAAQLEKLQTKASEILNKFGYKVELDLDFQRVAYNQDEKTLDNQEILLKVEFFDTDISAHHRFLNEAKLSAIAIAIYLSSILCLPEPKEGMKILALDDVLIGLDMSNRLPVLDILNDYFPDHQIFLTTYDKAWYEIAKQRTSRSGKWKAVEFYFSQTDAYEIPVYAEDKAYLERARGYLDVNDYKACAIYVRTAFEAAIKHYCERKDLAIKYRENPRDLRSEDFWIPIKMEKDEAGLPLLDLRVVDKIEWARKFILNELSHATFANIYRKELEDAIDAVEQLENALAAV